MTEVLLRLTMWSAVYLLVALLPLGVALLGEAPQGRGFFIELGVGLGMVGFAMLGLQFVTTSRFRWVAPYFGTDAQIQFHRETGIVALVFVLAHPLVLFVAHPAYLEFLNPWVNLLRALALSAATAALVALVATSVWRIGLGLSYEWWRIVHGGLAAFVIIIGLVHALQVGHYVAGMSKQAIWVVSTALIVILLMHTRVLKPLRMRSLPWRVAQVEENSPGTYTLALEAVGHAGMRFRAGQYAWLTIGSTPFTLQQHPFSFSSSAEQAKRLEFAIKESGDFTATIKHLQPGTQAYVEGPYGRFILDPRAEGAVFVVGGIGVTPALSILRTCRDRKDPRPLLLIYANDTWEDIAYRETFDEMRSQLNLEIVHVLGDSPDDWKGETGYVTAELLSRYLETRQHQDLQYFVCGPTPMMDQVEKALDARGVPHWRLVSERFNMV